MILSFAFAFSQQKVIVKPVAKKGGYQINIKTQNLAGKTIKLSIYNGNYKQVFRIDSVAIKKNDETVVFKQNKNIISLIYQIAITGKPNKTDVLVENGSNLSFSLNDDNVENIITENPLNKSFIAYQKMPVSPEKNTFLDNLQKKNPTNNALKYFSLFEFRKTKRKAPSQDDDSFRNELSEGIDFNNKVISILPNSYSFLYTFFNSTNIDNKIYKTGIDKLLKNQDCNNNNFKFYVTWIFKNLELNQTKNLNEIPEYVINKYVNNKTCYEKNKTWYDATVKKSREFTKFTVGSLLPDFEMEKMDGSLFTLKDFNKEKVNVILFYDPNCDHCKKEVPVVTKDLKELEQKTNQKIGKIAILNTDLKADWKDFIDKNGLQDWQNITYKDKDSTTKEALDAFTNPKYFIIDKDGKILLKIYSRSMIEGFLTQ